MHLWTICAISCEVGYVLFYGAYVGHRPDSEPQYMLCCFVILYVCVDYSDSDPVQLLFSGSLGAKHLG